MVESTVTITGRVAGDVTFNRYDGGRTRATFRIAFSRSWYDAELGGYVNGPTSFLTVKCWRRLAENVASSLGKGQPVVVTGRITVSSWERDGQKVSEAEIVASAVGHDLNYGTAAFRRASRGEWNPEAATNEAGTNGPGTNGPGTNESMPTTSPDSDTAADRPSPTDVTAETTGLARGDTREEASAHDGDGGDDPWPADSAVGANRRAA